MTAFHGDMPRGCMINLASGRSEGHAELVDLTQQLRAEGFEVIRLWVARAVDEGELPAGRDAARLARFIQTLQSGMAIRARDGSESQDLKDVAEVAMSGWDAMILRCTKSGNSRTQD